MIGNCWVSLLSVQESFSKHAEMMQILSDLTHNDLSLDLIEDVTECRFQISQTLNTHPFKMAKACFIGLHLVIKLSVEVTIHVSLKDNWEMVPPALIAV
jgi:hypothetical protein